MHSNCFALSEPHYFDTQIKADDLCSCEKKYSQCDFWQLVISKLKEQGITIDNFNTSSVPFYSSNSLLDKIVKNLNLFFYFKTGFPFLYREYFNQIKNEARLLEVISESVKEQYIVDASKSFVRALFLHKYLENKFDTFYIILSRDPKSNVYSQMKTSSKIQFSGRKELIVKTKDKGATLKEALHQWIRITQKYLLMNKIFNTRAVKVIYAEFTNDPKVTFLEKVSEYLNIHWEDNMLDLTSKRHHLLGGNYSRINAKVIHPAKDEWKNLTKRQIDYIEKTIKVILNHFHN